MYSDVLTVYIVPTIYDICLSSMCCSEVLAFNNHKINVDGGCFLCEVQFTEVHWALGGEGRGKVREEVGRGGGVRPTCPFNYGLLWMKATSMLLIHWNSSKYLALPFPSYRYTVFRYLPLSVYPSYISH